MSHQSLAAPPRRLCKGILSFEAKGAFCVGVASDGFLGHPIMVIHCVTVAKQFFPFWLFLIGGFKQRFLFYHLPIWNDFYIG